MMKKSSKKKTKTEFSIQALSMAPLGSTSSRDTGSFVWMEEGKRVTAPAIAIVEPSMKAVLSLPTTFRGEALLEEKRIANRASFSKAQYDLQKRVLKAKRFEHNPFPVLYRKERDGVISASIAEEFLQTLPICVTLHTAYQMGGSLHDVAKVGNTITFNEMGCPTSFPYGEEDVIKVKMTQLKREIPVSCFVSLEEFYDLSPGVDNSVAKAKVHLTLRRDQDISEDEEVEQLKKCFTDMVNVVGMSSGPGAFSFIMDVIHDFELIFHSVVLPPDVPYLQSKPLQEQESKLVTSKEWKTFYPYLLRDLPKPVEKFLDDLFGHFYLVLLEQFVIIGGNHPVLKNSQQHIVPAANLIPFVELVKKRYAEGVALSQEMLFGLLDSFSSEKISQTREVERSYLKWIVRDASHENNLLTEEKHPLTLSIKQASSKVEEFQGNLEASGKIFAEHKEADLKAAVDKQQQELLLFNSEVGRLNKAILLSKKMHQGFLEKAKKLSESETFEIKESQALKKSYEAFKQKCSEEADDLLSVHQGLERISEKVKAFGVARDRLQRHAQRSAERLKEQQAALPVKVEVNEGAPTNAVTVKDDVTRIEQYRAWLTKQKEYQKNFFKEQEEKRVARLATTPDCARPAAPAASQPRPPAHTLASKSQLLPRLDIMDLQFVTSVSEAKSDDEKQIELYALLGICCRLMEDIKIGNQSFVVHPDTARKFRNAIYHGNLSLSHAEVRQMVFNILEYVGQEKRTSDDLKAIDRSGLLKKVVDSSTPKQFFVEKNILGVEECVKHNLKILSKIKANTTLPPRILQMAEAFGEARVSSYASVLKRHQRLKDFCRKQQLAEQIIDDMIVRGNRFRHCDAASGEMKVGEEALPLSAASSTADFPVLGPALSEKDVAQFLGFFKSTANSSIARSSPQREPSADGPSKLTI